MKARIVIIFVGIVGLWSLLVLRAGYLQFMPNGRLNSLKSRQFQTNVTLQARRGAIVDTHGRDLAMSATAYSLYADPKILTNKKSTAKKLAKALGQPSELIFNKIKDGSRRFVWIQRKLEQPKADEIKAWNIRGLSFVEEWRRVYPNETLLAQSLGFVGSDGMGLEGLELGFNNLLAGNQKKVVVKRDARGRPLINDGLMFTENPEGSELRLTVDSELQYRLETELANAVSNFDAEQAVGVVLDAKTSAILAMASAPTFDLNKAMKSPPESRRNRALTDAFEPGSTMKAFVIATALRDGVVKPTSKFYCEKGAFKVGSHYIREAESKEKFENLTVSDILAVSSNVGTTKIAFKMGAEKMRKGLLDFGFGQKSGIEMPGEARGLVQSLPWKLHLQSNISFGHGISSTPLQIANAFAAIANGGTLNTPYIVKSIHDFETGEVTETKVKSQRRILSEEQAEQMRTMLIGVTAKGGTGGNARVDGFLVGGKTGTAQKVNPNGRGYLEGAYISTFGGFIPANDPRVVIYIAVDSPKKAYYGATVAAPVFARIASYAVRKEGIAPLPHLAEATNKTHAREIFLEANPIVTEAAVQNIKPDEVNTSNAEPAAVLSDATGPAEEAIETPVETIPELTNLTTREVLSLMKERDIKVKFVGQGKVSEVIPSIGAPYPTNKEITVILR